MVTVNNKIIPKEKDNNFIETIIDIVLAMSIIVLSLKKGGFYKEDSIFVSLIICILTLLNIFYKVICKKEYIRFSKIDIFFSILIVSYSLPIVFKNYANLNDAIFELLRYVALYLVYLIVRKTKNVNVYKMCFIIVASVQSILGIDAMRNRIFENILSYISSGYLNKDFDRLSGSIQYANVTAIIIFIGIVSGLEYIKAILDSSKVKNKKYSCILFFVLSFNVLALMLTKSRAVIAIFFVSLIILSIKNKKKKLNIMTIFLIVQSLIFSSLINQKHFLIIFTAVNLALSYIFFMYAKSDKKVFIKGKKIIYIYILGITILYIFLAFRIKVPITISYKFNTNQPVTRNLYNLKEGKNIIKIKTQSLDYDSNFDIKVYEITKENNITNIYNINSLASGDGSFEFTYEKSENLKNLKFDFIAIDGNFKVNEININGKEMAINYILIPYDFVEKVEDILHGSNTIKDRISYNVDAVKIIFKSYKNFLFGTGGEGFKHLYRSVQTLDYSSTEVHNSYLQIFVEAGIFGFLSIVVICIISARKLKNISFEVAITFVGMLIHMLFDLDFSYLITIIYFGIFVGMIFSNDSKEKLHDVKKYGKVHITVFAFVVLFSTFTLLTANMALFSYENNYSYNSSSLEKTVALDFSEIKYRKKLNDEYTMYMKKLNDDDYVDENIVSEIVVKLKENTDKIYLYGREDITSIKYVNSIYIKYKEDFAKIYFKDDIASGIAHYDKFINDNILKVSNSISILDEKNDTKRKMIEETYK